MVYLLNIPLELANWSVSTLLTLVRSHEQLPQTPMRDCSMTISLTTTLQWLANNSSGLINRVCCGSWKADSLAGWTAVEPVNNLGGPSTSSYNKMEVSVHIKVPKSFLGVMGMAWLVRGVECKQMDNLPWLWVSCVTLCLNFGFYCNRNAVTSL